MSAYRHFSLALLVLSTVQPFALAQRERKPVALPGPVIFDARKAKELKHLPIRHGVQFGIFRDELLGKNENWVEYWLEPVELKNGAKVQFLAIYYNVSKADTYNGIWFKLGEADWTK